MRHYELMVILDPDLEERTVAPSLDQFLGVVRQVIPSNALDRIANAPHLTVPMALATAIIGLLAWAGAAFAAGAWRTKTTEI